MPALTPITGAAKRILFQHLDDDAEVHEGRGRDEKGCVSLLLDRDVGVMTAVHTSIRAVLANPMTMAIWGLIVAVALLIGSLPLFVGLSVVMPVLGHATWHLYRKVVER